jgi:predicted nucleic acid-binding protein
LKFWDTSALVPLLVNEATTPAMTGLFFSDPQRAVWWATHVECVSALSRRLRFGEIDQPEHDIAMTRLNSMQLDWVEAPPTDDIRLQAERLLAAHPLRAADAFQLAAALDVAKGGPVAFVSLDDKLCDAARAEGFAIEP